MADDFNSKITASLESVGVIDADISGNVDIVWFNNYGISVNISLEDGIPVVTIKDNSAYPSIRIIADKTPALVTQPLLD